MSSLDTAAAIEDLRSVAAKLRETQSQAEALLALRTQAILAARAAKVPRPVMAEAIGLSEAAVDKIIRLGLAAQGQTAHAQPA